MTPIRVIQWLKWKNLISQDACYKKNMGTVLRCLFSLGEYKNIIIVKLFQFMETSCQTLVKFQVISDNKCICH